MAMVQTFFRLFGPVSAVQGDRAVDLGGPMARAVLAVLLLRGRAGVTVDGLLESVWGAEGASRESVYHYVSSLRAALAAADADVGVDSCRPGYRMLVAEEAVDWHRFRGLVAQARRVRDLGRRDEAAALLTKACEMWPGVALEGIGERLAGPRREMHEAWLVATEELAALEAARGIPERVVELLEDASADHPGRERMAQLLIEALVMLGRRDEIASVYQRTHRYLAEHHGLSPGATLGAAYRAGLRADEVGARRLAAVRLGPVAGDLPRAAAIFAGRGAELDRVMAALRPGSSPASAVCGISGMPGVGKTALAIHAAHRLVDVYPDGCLFVDLHGSTAGSLPENPEDVLDRLLRRLGVSAEEVPDHVDDRAALLRRRLDGRRLLLILDDVHDVGQVRLLLPEAPGCGVLLTSRTRLTALDEAELIDLGVLGGADGAAVFRSVAGQRLETEPDAIESVDRVVAACGGLPLAIRIAAARFRSEPDPLAVLCGRLEDEQVRLGELDDGHRSVASALAVSYTGLAPDLRRALALLGVHPGTEFAPHAVAALLDAPLARTGLLLNGLVNRHLLTRPDPGRYRFHDLVAAFARECLAVASVGERDALGRLLDYHLHVAEVADIAITPHRHRIPLGLDHRPRAAPDVRHPDDAMRWLSAQEAVLVSLCHRAAEHGFDAACWRLAYTLRGYFFLTKRWRPWVETHEEALGAARRLGDVLAEALTLNNLGLAAIERRQSRLAQCHYERALELFRQIGDEPGEYTAQANLAWIHFEAGRYREFLADLRRAHAFYERSGARRNAAITLRGIALGEIEIGEYAEAVNHLDQVRVVFEELGLNLDLAMALNALGEAHGRRGDPTAAVRWHRSALEASLRCGSTYEAARAQHRLGDLAAGAGDVDGARGYWDEASRAYGALGAPQADEVRARLAQPVD
jgi:DNA-binding SARP family transcriptional activator